MNRPLFFLRAFNDIDHLSPIIDKFAQMGDEVHVILFSEFMDYEADYRIAYLAKNPKIFFHYEVDKSFTLLSGMKKLNSLDKLRRKMLLLRRKNNILSKLLNKLLEDSTFDQTDFLLKNKITQCIFEWGAPGARGENQRKYFLAAKSIGIFTFSLPHGCNIYLNQCVTDYQKKLSYKGKSTSLKEYSDYDYLVLQNKSRRDQFVQWGANPVKTQVWGSVRFDPIWQKKNLEICPKFCPKYDDSDKLKVVFMHHQFKYRLHEKKIWSLLDRLIQEDWIYLVIKDSTREGLTLSSEKFYNSIDNYKNVQRVGNEAHSPSLIHWADTIINFGSSIAIEVILQEKQLITPSYLHENKTLFERYEVASDLANSEDEVLSLIKLKREGEAKIQVAADDNPVIKEVVYGGSSKHDVLESYYRKLTSFELNY